VHTEEATDAEASVLEATPRDTAPISDDTTPTDVVDAPAAPIPAVPPSPPGGRRRPLALDLTLLAVVGLFLLAALGAGVATIYQQFYSPTAFALRYVDELANGHAADALNIPGVAVDSSQLEASGLPLRASDALLRSAALASLTDIHVVSTTQQGGETHVTIAYRAGGHPGTTEFTVERAGWIGVAPSWRFARSPLAVINLKLRGSMQFDVNGFEVDKRQVSDDAASNPEATVPLLVFSPGLYSVTVATPISESRGVAVLSNTPMKATPIDIQTQPTKEFEKAVQTRVHEFLTACAQQKVLQPTGCPFGYVEENRIIAPPTWSMVKQPAVVLAPDGEGWRIQTAPATAHIRADVRSIFDGTVRHLNEDVPFLMTGTVTVQPDGSAAISVTGLNPD
jgi:hypothetical protein